MTTRPNEYHLNMIDVVSNALREDPDHVPDMIDWNWWNDEQLHDFISKPANIADINEDNLEALTEEISRRVDAKLKERKRSQRKAGYVVRRKEVSGR